MEVVCEDGFHLLYAVGGEGWGSVSGRDGHFGFGCGADDGAVMACNSMGEMMAPPYICVLTVTLDVVPAAFVLLALSPFPGKNGFYGPNGHFE